MTLERRIILGTQTAPASATSRDVIISTFNWAVITDDAPLTIRFDGQTTDLDIVPDTIIDPALLVIGTRVWVQQWGRRVLIIGIAGGSEGSTGGGEELLVTAKTSPTTFTALTDIVWSAADVNEAGWTRDGTNVYWTCQQAGVYGIKFLYATTGLTSGATRAILYVETNSGGTQEARIVLVYNTVTQTASTSMTATMDVGDRIRAAVQSSMSVTLSEVNLYVVKK